MQLTCSVWSMANGAGVSWFCFVLAHVFVVLEPSHLQIATQLLAGDWCLNDTTIVACNP